MSWPGGEGCDDSLSPLGIRHRIESHPDQLQVVTAGAAQQLAEAGQQQPLGEVPTRSEYDESSDVVSHDHRVPLQD
jgi:hypothetical protein